MITVLPLDGAVSEDNQIEPRRCYPAKRHAVRHYWHAIYYPCHYCSWSLKDRRLLPGSIGLFSRAAGRRQNRRATGRFHRAPRSKRWHQPRPQKQKARHGNARRADNPDLHGLVRGLVDWSCELRRLEKEKEEQTRETECGQCTGPPELPTSRHSWPTFAWRAVPGTVAPTSAPEAESPPRQCQAGGWGEEPDAT